MPTEPSVQPLDAVIADVVARAPGQMSRSEYSYIVSLVADRPGCRLLVFGAGDDSGLWLLANPGGRTTFLESSRFWGDLVRWRHPGIDVRMVRYGTRMSAWRELLAGPGEDLMLELPPDVAAESWDVILVDGPAGNRDSSPGRMKSIYTAASLARRRPDTDVIVHDCDRHLERAYCDQFLRAAPLVHELQRTRHYRTVRPEAPRA